MHLTDTGAKKLSPKEEQRMNRSTFHQNDKKNKEDNDNKDTLVHRNGFVPFKGIFIKFRFFILKIVRVIKNQLDLRW